MLSMEEGNDECQLVRDGRKRLRRERTVLLEGGKEDALKGAIPHGCGRRTGGALDDR